VSIGVDSWFLIVYFSVLFACFVVRNLKNPLNIYIIYYV